MFKNVLTATDLLEASDGAVTSAIELCRRNAARLRLLHVLESSYSGIFRHFVREFKTGQERVVSKEYEKTAKRALAAKWALTLGPYMNCDIEITAGVPWIEILRAARKTRADLVVLGSHGKGAEEKGVIRRTGTVGSTVEGVLMGANCPVLIVNRTIKEEKLGFGKIMVCVDFSRSCEYATAFASQIAAVYGSRLLLFHVFRVTPFARYFQTKFEEEKSRVNERLRAYCKDIGGGVECRCDLREATLPHAAILNYASENRVDLIVMGSHTRRSPEKRYVGSTVQEVSTRADCPTAVVTHPQAVRKTVGNQLHEDSERRRNEHHQHSERA
jgi:nucleotide-binding universal stress UspA family protein